MAFCYRGDPHWLIVHPTLGCGDGLTYGCAVVPGPFRPLNVIFSDGEGWEHVSVSTPNRPPNWEEMCLIKRLFWGPDDTVLQFHPPEREYVNNHPHCLHLWRQCGTDAELPPSILVGYVLKEG